MKRSTALAVSVLAVAGLLLVLTAGPASAHEERTVGKYHFAVGFGSEPAYAGIENSVQLFLHDAKDRPVTDLGDTLKIEVIFGDQKAQYPIEPDFEVGEFGIPGDYRAWFIPTRPGQYTFHLFGSIKGQKVDESFTSGPSTFSEVDDPTAVEFPVKDPTVGQIAQRLDREFPRQESAVTTVQKAATAAQSAASSAKDAGDSAKTLSVVGIVVGALGLVAGAGGLVAARRSRRPVPAASAEAPTGRS